MRLELKGTIRMLTTEFHLVPSCDIDLMITIQTHENCIRVAFDDLNRTRYTK